MILRTPILSLSYRRGSTSTSLHTLLHIPIGRPLCLANTTFDFDNSYQKFFFAQFYCIPTHFEHYELSEIEKEKDGV